MLDAETARAREFISLFSAREFHPRQNDYIVASRHQMHRKTNEERNVRDLTRKKTTLGLDSAACIRRNAARTSIAREEKVVRRALRVRRALLQVHSRGPLLLRQQNYINTNRCRNGSTSLFNFPVLLQL